MRFSLCFQRFKKEMDRLTGGFILTLAVVGSSVAMQPPDPIRNSLSQTGTETVTRKPDPRIVGGNRVADRCLAPFSSMVALQLQANDSSLRVTYCSGVMLSPDLVVTAGVCLFPYRTFPVPVIMAIIGEKHFYFRDTYQVNVPVSKFKIHPAYNQITGDNNIALIKLSRSVPLSRCVQPLRRFSPRTTASQCTSPLMNCTITGWGVTDLSGDMMMNSPNPMYGLVQVADEQLSALLSGNGVYRTTPLGRNSLYATAHADSPTRACVFDWGGMVACKVDTEWTLRGVVGHHNCMATHQPSPTEGLLDQQPIAVTDMVKFRSWIDYCFVDFDSSVCTTYSEG